MSVLHPANERADELTAVLVVQTFNVYELIARHFKIARDDMALERLTALDAFVERTAKSLLDAPPSG